MNHWNIARFAVTLNIKVCGTHPIPKKLGRICQSVVSGKNGPQNQDVKVTDTFRVIKSDDIPQDRRKEICNTSVVPEIRPNKDDPNHTRITVAGNYICYPGYVATPTGSL